VEAHRRPPFDHVVADEAQDFGPRELRFLMALAPPSAYGHFFTGDSGQRIYRYPFAWSRAGIDLRGRGATLVVNYRTTNQIRNFSAAVLGDVEPNSEDEFLAGEAVSLMSGPHPTIERCESPEEESDKLADWLRQLFEQGVESEEVAIFARTSRLLEERVEPALEILGIPANVIGANRRDKGGGIAIGSLHSAKGLEFRAVAIVACDVDIIPHLSALASADDEESKAIAEARERQLFYVGSTRPRELLRISYCRKPTKVLPTA
jgi:superfamily I DNA/RNA helicase